MGDYTFRIPTHAGSWYSGASRTLAAQLDGWLDAVPDTLPLDENGNESLKLPLQGGRIIIAPHAGYAYSGPCAAYAYKALDLSKCERILLLGPSHHVYTSKALVPDPSMKGAYTPLSSHPLQYDTDTITALRTNDSKVIDTMSPDVEEAEHSLEMHLPYIHRIIQRTFGTSDDAISKYPGIVPIMVGATRQATEERLGEILAPFFRDPHTAIVISSDFAHWGQRFQYRFYSANAKTPALPLPLSAANLPQPNRGLTPARLEETLARLREGARPAAGARGRPYIHESISACDIAAMEALTLYPLASKQQADDPQGFEGSSVFNAVDGFTLAMNAAGGNTICGRHPISVALHALEHLYEGEDPSDEQEARFRFLRYERSGDVVSPTDSSVSYVSAVATLP